MKRKIFKIIITVIIFTVIPSFLSYIANSDYFFDCLKNFNILNENLDISSIQDICLWLSIALSAILLSYNLAKTQIENEQILKQRDQLIKMTKDVFGNALTTHFSKNFSDFDVRIFVPKYPKLYYFFELIRYKNFKKTFIIKNISQIAQEDVTKNLEFQVSPKCQGLVGTCYSTKAMVYDDNLETTNSKNYNMDKNQVSRTSNLQWSICCPILDNTDKIVAIIALDGRKKLSIKEGKQSELNKQIITFSRMLYDAVPQLFRR